MAVGSASLRYNHADWALKRRFLRFLIKYIGFTLLAKVDQVDGIQNVPKSGPGILLINHIALIDPILVIHLLPRNIVPLAKMEVYDYPFVGIFPKMWGVVPLKRDEIDRQAIHQVMAILRAGEMVLVAPEGTRHHELQQGRVGVAYLASRMDVPVIPVAIDGTEGFPVFRTSKRWRGPGAHVRFGRPLRYKAEFAKARGKELRLMTDEAMYYLASLLPENRRGAYSDFSRATQTTFDWVGR
jgi:1-acyl-sn-glycerol-3-phosphate acyltransferase